ncbi:hypothetical protein AAY473_030708 [Plecturocebus cupreus]
MESSTHVRLRMTPQLLSPTCAKKSLGGCQAGHRKGLAARESSCPLERQSRPRAEGSAESAPPRVRRRAGVLDPGAPPGTASGAEIPRGRQPPCTAAPRVPIAPGKGPGERLRPGQETGSTRLGPRAACAPLQAPGSGRAPGAGEGQDRLPTAASRPAGDEKARAESPPGSRAGSRHHPGRERRRERPRGGGERGKEGSADCGRVPPGAGAAVTTEEEAEETAAAPGEGVVITGYCRSPETFGAGAGPGGAKEQLGHLGLPAPGAGSGPAEAGPG